jgi:hypothetical protein
VQSFGLNMTDSATWNSTAPFYRLDADVNLGAATRAVLVQKAHFRGTEVDLHCTSTIRPSVNSAMLTILLAQGMLGMGYARGGSTECHVNG